MDSTTCWGLCRWPWRLGRALRSKNRSPTSSHVTAETRGLSRGAYAGGFMSHGSARQRKRSSSQPVTARHWQRIGLWLVGATMAYNVAEGILALWAGIQARSIALVGFGLDSFIECSAATALLWRLGVAARGTNAEIVERSERRVHRFVGATFLVLALYVLL